MKKEVFFEVVLIVLAVLMVLVLSNCAYLTGRTAGEIVDDSSIKTVINSKIVEDKELSYLKIDVDSKKGNVVLTGFVPNQRAEERLIELARQVRGVKSVKSELKIEKK